MTDWYYADAQNQRHGPLPAADLAALHAQAALRPETLVWREGLAAWTPWRQVMHEIVPPAAASAGAPPVPPPASEDASPYAPPRAVLQDDSAIVAGNHVVYAGFWKRVAASIIDSFVTSFVMWILMIPLFMVIGGGISAMASVNDGSNMLLTALYYLISLAIPLFYMAWMHSSANQATLGKMAVGIKVTDTEGRRLTLGRALLRWLAVFLDYITLYVGYLIAAFTERKQGLHDMVVGTLVVDRWAYTAHPDWQQRGLGTVTKVILAIAGVLYGLMFIAVIAAIVVPMALQS